MLLTAVLLWRKACQQHAASALQHSLSPRSGGQASGCCTTSDTLLNMLPCFRAFVLSLVRVHAPHRLAPPHISQAVPLQDRAASGRMPALAYAHNLMPALVLPQHCSDLATTGAVLHQLIQRPQQAALPAQWAARLAAAVQLQGTTVALACVPLVGSAASCSPSPPQQREQCCSAHGRNSLRGSVSCQQGGCCPHSVESVPTGVVSPFDEAPLCLSSSRWSTGSSGSYASAAPSAAMPVISPVSVSRKRPFASLASLSSCRLQDMQDHSADLSGSVQRKAQCRRPVQGNACHDLWVARQQAAMALEYANQAAMQLAAVQRSLSSTRPVPASSPLVPLLKMPSSSVNDVLACAFKCMGFEEPSTLQLALHCCARVHQHPTLSVMLSHTRACYSIVTLWLAAKLEEKRSGLVGAARVAQLVGTSAKAVAAMEVQVGSGDVAWEQESGQGREWGGGAPGQNRFQRQQGNYAPAVWVLMSNDRSPIS